MKCSVCGREVSKGKVFCPDCGNRMPMENVVNNETSEISDNTANPIGPFQGDGTYHSAQMSVDTEAEEAEKKKRLLLRITIAVFLAVAFVVMGIVFFIAISDRDTSTEPDIFLDGIGIETGYGDPLADYEKPEEPSVKIEADVSINSKNAIEVPTERMEFLKSSKASMLEINWDKSFCLSKETDGVVVSTLLFKDEYDDYLLVGFTNTYETDVSVMTEFDALASDGSKAGNQFAYCSCLAPGDTYFISVFCMDKAPSGEIDFRSVVISNSLYKSSKLEITSKTMWGEADHLSLNTNLELYNGSPVLVSAGLITVIALDDDGNLLGFSQNFCDDIIPGRTVKTNITTYGINGELQEYKDIVIFCNPSSQ